MKNGKHLLIDAYGCNRDPLNDADLIRNMLLDVTELIGLKPLSDPHSSVMKYIDNLFTAERIKETVILRGSAL